jgi:hypothetical protein
MMGGKAEAGNLNQARGRRGIESMDAKARQGDPQQCFVAGFWHPLDGIAGHKVDHRINAAARTMVDGEDADAADLDTARKGCGREGAQRALFRRFQADLIVGDETTRTIVNQAKSKVTLAGARGAAQEKAGGCDDEAGSMHRRHGRFQAAWLDSGSHSRARIATPLSAPRSFSQTAWLRSRREIRARAFR